MTNKQHTPKAYNTSSHHRMPFTYCWAEADVKVGALTCDARVPLLTCPFCGHMRMSTSDHNCSRCLHCVDAAVILSSRHHTHNPACLAAPAPPPCPHTASQRCQTPRGCAPTPAIQHPRQPPAGDKDSCYSLGDSHRPITHQDDTAHCGSCLKLLSNMQTCRLS